jgi:hypothetical protein
MAKCTSNRARATRTYKNLILQKMDILMSDEVRYFWPDDDKLSYLRPSDMSDSSIMLRRYTTQKIKKP